MASGTTLTPDGIPLFEGTLGHRVRPLAVHDAGDHTIVIGRVTGARRAKGDPSPTSRRGTLGLACTCSIPGHELPMTPTPIRTPSGPRWGISRGRNRLFGDRQRCCGGSIA